MHSRWHCPLASIGGSSTRGHPEQVAHERGQEPRWATQSAIARTSRLFRTGRNVRVITLHPPDGVVVRSLFQLGEFGLGGSLAVDVAIAFRFFTLFA